MHLGLEELAGFFARHRCDDHLVLATVVATEGSTYRKPGAMMLIAGSGSYRGLISGGCLESDLVEQARAVFDDGLPRRVVYDLKDDEDLVWGLGLGCGGAVHLSLRRLLRDRDYPMLEAVFASLERGDTCWLALEVEYGRAGSALGWAVSGSAGALGDEGLAGWLSELLNTGSDGPRFFQGRCPSLPGEPERERSAVAVRIEPAPRLLICGAGPDAVPMARLATDLGWHCTITDHRPAFARADRFPASCTVVHTRPDQLGEALDLSAVSAAIVMSHHVEHDGHYLEQLLRHEPAYLGVLGPGLRRQRLEDRLGLAAGRLRGPAGLDIGAELPGSIALSVLAEIHATLNGRSGAPLSPRA